MHAENGDVWTYLVSAQIGSTVLEGLGNIWVEDELGCDGRHHVGQCGDERDAIRN